MGIRSRLSRNQFDQLFGQPTGIAGVACSISVAVRLVRVERLRAIVARVADPVGVHIGLVGIRDEGAVVDVVRPAVLVSVSDTTDNARVGCAARRCSAIHIDDARLHDRRKQPQRHARQRTHHGFLMPIGWPRGTHLNLPWPASAGVAEPDRRADVVRPRETALSRAR